MSQTNTRRWWLSYVLCAGVFGGATFARATEYMCYLPGANGLTSYMKDFISKVLVMKGIPFIAFDPGEVGTVQQRSERFVRQFAEVIKKDPQAKCHIFGYSMGGLIGRWSVNHATIQGPNGLERVQDRVLSLTTAASPHLGTPLARILRQYWSSAAPGVEQLSEENVVQFNDPASNDFSPVVEGVPTYSYRTFITRKEDADQPLVLIGFQLIWQDRTNKNLDPLNDGIIPTDHQAFGEVLGDLNISHGYFHHETGFRVRLEDFLEAHWSFLTKGTKPLLF
jgi:pimeloyl-ACP methyl ester carboxylesterase